jgi:hypothetical protein
MLFSRQIRFVSVGGAASRNNASSDRRDAIELPVIRDELIVKENRVIVHLLHVTQ